MLIPLITIIISILSLVYAFFLSKKITEYPEGNEKMREIANAIREGASAFLSREYRIIGIFLVVVAIVLYFLIGEIMAFTFIMGGIFSVLAGYFGMRVATMANVRTAYAAKKGIKDALRIAFSSGSVMGLIVVGLGTGGVSLLYMVFNEPKIIFGFGFGASSIALFARVGGGIYTKAADIGADIVGKVEAGIPEDDPRNPAVISDLVGDNVGDVAGMGADLYESYVNSIIAAMVIGFSVAGSMGLVLPLLISSAGIISSVIGMLFVRVGKSGNIQSALNRGVFISSALAVASFYFLTGLTVNKIGIFYAALSGILAGILIGVSTEYFTSEKRKPTKSIANSSMTGATNIIQGISVGMFSTIFPVLVVCGSIFVSYHYGGLYGIALSAVGMLSTLAITLATDTYGPVADNSAGIAEMAGIGKTARRRAESLDAVGNTTAAIGKGMAIGSAALTALALFVTYTSVTGINTINIANPNTLIGVFIGGMIPFLFSALTIVAVGRAASKMIEEVRRQFNSIEGLKEGSAKPDYKNCVSISTSAALRGMVLPSIIAIIVPILIGMWNVEALGGLLVGTLITGFLLAVFMANSGGAWDNAKKYIESGAHGGKGSDHHKSAVIGDTVGDPFKDTAGPSLNILIKLMSIVAIVFVPLFL